MSWWSSPACTSSASGSLSARIEQDGGGSRARNSSRFIAYADSGPAGFATKRMRGRRSKAVWNRAKKRQFIYKHTLLTYTTDLNATLIATPEYETKEAKLLDEEEKRELEFSISTNPEAHPVIKDTGGVRKARWARKGMGKSGGVRFIYFYVDSRGVVYMISAFAKNEKANLSQKERNALYDLAKRFKHEKERI
jgi:hypothetical protein